VTFSTDRGQLRHVARQSRTGPVARTLLELVTMLPIGRTVRWLEDRPTLHGLALLTIGLRQPVFLDHRGDPEPRFGYGRPEHPEITALLDRGRARYLEHIERFVARADALAAIPVRAPAGGGDPYWDNAWLPPLDALAVYGFLADGNPRRYVEIGSGNSTRFARRAIADHGLRTRITSIDPAPRANVDALCDQVVRRPLGKADLSVFAELEAGDIVFLDGSHRVFMGSDAAVFFFEVLPKLRPGVLVHVHDVVLPRDYPPAWRWRYYSEQYLLAAFLLANPAGFVVELPNAFVDGTPELRCPIAALWRRLGITEEYLPASFWLRPCSAG
jgi:hypothetical protein